MKILDATCGVRSIWYQKNHPFVTYMDIRKVNNKQQTFYKLKDRRLIRINPDLICDWQQLPFKNDSFDVVLFDPPHIVRSKRRMEKSKHVFMEKYGYIYLEEFPLIIKRSLKELFRVLKTEGIFILKWNECDISVKHILKLFPYKPLFGDKLERKNNTYWILFIKHRFEKSLNLKF